MPALSATRQSQDSLRVGLVGAGIQASRSPAMHVAAGRALGLDLSYDLIDTDTADWQGLALDALLTRLADAGFAGVNVTFPHKRAALALCDTVAPSAAAVGATNTIVFRGGQRIAHNTDYSGFAAGFLAGIGGRDHATALLIGAGGAGGAVAQALVDHGVKRLFIHDTESAAAVRHLLTAALRPGWSRRSPTGWGRGAPCWRVTCGLRRRWRRGSSTRRPSAWPSCRACRWTPP